MYNAYLTLSLDDDVVARAGAVAHRHGTSLDALIRRYVERLADQQSGMALAEQFDALWRSHLSRSGGWRFNREELYEDRTQGCPARYSQR